MTETLEYTVILERGESSWSAFVPDLPGCVAAAATHQEAEQLIREAVELHVALMREDGDALPEPRTLAGLVAVPAR
jgi:predicted RNase H-like HicB family nuclease